MLTYCERNLIIILRSVMNDLNTTAHCHMRPINLHCGTNYSSKCTEQQLHCWAVHCFIGCNLLFQDVFICNLAEILAFDRYENDCCMFAPASCLWRWFQSVCCSERGGRRQSTSSLGLPSMSSPGTSFSLLVAQLSSWKRTTLACLSDRRQIFIEILTKFKAVVLFLLTSLTCSPEWCCDIIRNTLFLI